MNIPQITQYMNEAGGILNEWDQAKAAVDQLTELIRAADGMSDHQRELALTNQRTQYQKALAGLEKHLLQVTQRSDPERARELVVDLQIAVENSHKAHRQWRALVAEFEFAASEGGFVAEPEEGQQPQGLTRSFASGELDKAKARVEKRVEQAALLVPNRPVILL